MAIIHWFRFTSYEDLTVQIFGKRWGLIVEINIILFCFATAVAYIIAVGQLLEPIITIAQSSGSVTLPSWVDKQFAMISFWMVVMFPLSSLDKINSLRFTSLFGVLSIFFLVVSTIVHHAISLGPQQSGLLPAASSYKR